MTVERILDFDESSKILKVKAVTQDTFSEEQVKSIYRDIEAKLKNAEKSFSHFKDVKLALKMISTDNRLREAVETMMLFIPNAGEIPDMESTEKALKYWRETKKQLEKDLEQLKPFVKQ